MERVSNLRNWTLALLALVIGVGVLARIGYALPIGSFYHAEWLMGLFGLAVGLVFFLVGALMLLVAYIQAKKLGTVMAYYVYLLSIIAAGMFGLVGLLAVINGITTILENLP